MKFRSPPGHFHHEPTLIIKCHVNTSFGLVGGMHPLHPPLCPRLLQTFIFTFLLGIYNLKPVALCTNSMKKCMSIENVGRV